VNSALAVRPDILVLDEPTAGMDAVATRGLLGEKLGDRPVEDLSFVQPDGRRIDGCFKPFSAALIAGPGTSR